MRGERDGKQRHARDVLGHEPFAKTPRSLVRKRRYVAPLVAVRWLRFVQSTTPNTKTSGVDFDSEIRARKLLIHSDVPVWRLYQEGNGPVSRLALRAVAPRPRPNRRPSGATAARSHPARLPLRSSSALRKWKRLRRWKRPQFASTGSNRRGAPRGAWVSPNPRFAVIAKHSASGGVPRKTLSNPRDDAARTNEAHPQKIPLICRPPSLNPRQAETRLFRGWLGTPPQIGSR